MSKEPKEPLGPIAFLVVFVSVATMLASGGCTLLAVSDPPTYEPGILIITGVPFLPSAVACCLAWTLGRRPAEEDEGQRQEG
jgi:hypothetical protein